MSYSNQNQTKLTQKIKLIKHLPITIQSNDCVAKEITDPVAKLRINLKSNKLKTNISYQHSTFGTVFKTQTSDVRISRLRKKCFILFSMEHIQKKD